jgi:hypothetical protein
MFSTLYNVVHMVTAVLNGSNRQTISNVIQVIFTLDISTGPYQIVTLYR